MYKYINFNNLRKKKEFVDGDGGVVVGWNSPLWKHKKQLGKYKKKKRENTKNNLFYEQWKKQWKHLFIVLKKVVFENTENTKNKNTPPSPNKFFVFFVFKNRKQFLKTRTKQALWLHFEHLIAPIRKDRIHGLTLNKIKYEPTLTMRTCTIEIKEIIIWNCRRQMVTKTCMEDVKTT